MAFDSPEVGTDAVDALRAVAPAHRAAVVGAWSEAARAAVPAAAVPLLVEAIASGAGTAADRLAVGELLGRLGDPRLRVPSDPDYWVALDVPGQDPVRLGRYPVTNAEYRAWVASGGYDDPTVWSDEGRAWLAQTSDPWPVLAERADAGPFIVPNQPVVGVSVHEAEAYARAHGARLPSWSERVVAVRGEGKRPYPWGSPFGEGRANTREEALHRPCAVGLYVADTTPEGIVDLAGNAGEWTSDRVGDEVLLHPGSWERPSLASWAKASTTAPPGARWSALGFRLASDARDPA